MKRITKTLTVLLISVLFFFSFTYSVSAQAFKQTGGGYDIFEGNNPSISSGWVDPVTGSIGNRIQGALTVWNTVSGTTAAFVKVRLEIPSNVATTHQIIAHIWADNAPEITDTLTINVGANSQLGYVPGHAVVFSPSCLNGCPLSDSALTGSGVTVGDITAGGSNSAQVTFKVDIDPVSTPTPTPTPTPTSTPSPTASPTPAPPGPTSSCTSLIASVTSGTRPLTVTFTGAGSDSAGSIQAYQFDFGDNSNGQNQIVTTTNNQASHIYNNAGTFIARLLVRDSRGVWVGSGNTNCQVNINVNNPPQVLGATAPPALPATGSNDFLLLVAAPLLIGGGIYLFRRFRLI